MLHVYCLCQYFFFVSVTSKPFSLKGGAEKSTSSMLTPQAQPVCVCVCVLVFVNLYCPQCCGSLYELDWTGTNEVSKSGMAETSPPSTQTQTNSSMNQHSNDSCVDIRISPISDLLIGIYITALVLGLVFNLLTAWPIIQQIRRKNVLGVYLLSLSVSDILYILTMPLWIIYYYNDHHWTLGLELCKLAGFIYYSNMYISIYLLCCISIDRCLAVTFPLKNKTFRRYSYAWLISGSIYIVSISLHILVAVMDKVMNPLDINMRCYETFPMTERVALFNLLRVVFGFLMPLLVLALCYFQIFRKVKKSVGLDEQAKRKVKLLSVGVITIFSVCYAPYHIQLLIRSIIFNCFERTVYCEFEQGQHFYFSVTLAMSSLNSVVDPLLYVLVSNGMRESIDGFCGKSKTCCLVTEKPEEEPRTDGTFFFHTGKK